MESHEQLCREFSRGGSSGLGPEMEPAHARIAERTIELMEIGPRDRILDLGCGDGWTCRGLAGLVPEGLVVGLDVSEEMVCRARAASRELDNVMFLNAGPAEIPWKEDFFSYVLSIEAFYYSPEPIRALHEVRRVLAPGGRFFMLISLYADNVESLQWAEGLNVPVTVLSVAQWSQLFRETGFEDLQEHRIVDDRAVPDQYQSRGFRDTAQFRRFLETGALLLMGEKTARITDS